jgi:hypothetical protein
VIYKAIRLRVRLQLSVFQYYQGQLQEIKAMATPIQNNLTTKNAEYSKSFTQGHLALPPAKKYLVRM